MPTVVWLQNKAGQIKGKKTPKSSRPLEDRMAMLDAKTDNSRIEDLFPDEMLKANDRNNLALDKKGRRTRQNHADI